MFKRKRNPENGDDSETDSENEAAGAQVRSLSRHVSTQGASLASKKPRKEKENGKLWTVQEVVLLLNSIKQHGLTETVWAQVAKGVPGRSGKQASSNSMPFFVHLLGFMAAG